MDIPGTTLPATKESIQNLEAILDSMFLAGGMTRSQIIALTGLEPYIVQNWVKRGFLSPPVDKKYTKRQLCRILNINALKNALSIEKICGLLTYVNGKLDDDGDDLIDDSDLFCMFSKIAFCVDCKYEEGKLPQLIQSELQNYVEPVEGAKERVAKVLMIMVVAWNSSVLQLKAESLLNQI